MFAPTSRYYHIETKTHEVDDDRTIAYVRRRFLPPGDEMPVLVEPEVTEGDRLDLVTSRTLGDPGQYWRVCDANDAMHPGDLVAYPGRRIRVPIPQF